MGLKRRSDQLPKPIAKLKSELESRGLEVSAENIGKLEHKIRAPAFGSLSASIINAPDYDTHKRAQHRALKQEVEKREWMAAFICDPPRAEEA